MRKQGQGVACWIIRCCTNSERTTPQNADEPSGSQRVIEEEPVVNIHVNSERSTLDLTTEVRKTERESFPELASRRERPESGGITCGLLTGSDV